MPVTRSAPRLLSLIFVVSVVSYCCFVFIGEIAEGQKGNYRKDFGKSKKIVAFSLLKQIEIESEGFHCNEKFLTREGFKEKQHGNQMWTKLEGTNVFVYSVYHDRRLDPYDYLRIITMVKGSWSDNLFCQILSSDGQYYVTKATAVKIWSKSWNRNDTHTYFNPYLISCHVPLNATPIYLSFSTKPCEEGVQRFKIPFTKQSEFPKKFENSFTICVKSLNFHEDISERLIPWIIINRILGATKIHLYVETLSKKTSKILEVFQKNFRGFLVLHHHNRIESRSGLDLATSIWQKRRYEIITYNDCLYRNIHTSHFVIPVDIDEVIVPRQVTTWAELLHELLSEGEDNFASYTVRNAYYLRQFNPKKFNEKVFFFRDVVRSEFSDERESGKSFISTRNALTVFNHYALKTLKPGLGKNKFLKKEVVQMNHYKDYCDIVILPECAKYLSSPVRIVDNVIFKYKTVFYREYGKLMKSFNHANVANLSLF